MSDEKFVEKVESRNKYVLKISYNGTKGNVDTHKEFRELAKKEYDNSYILCLKALLESRKENAQMVVMCESMLSLQDAVAELQSKDVPKPKAGLGTFGGGDV